jgi:hypothetical protein
MPTAFRCFASRTSSSSTLRTLSAHLSWTGGSGALRPNRRTGDFDSRSAVGGFSRVRNSDPLTTNLSLDPAAALMLPQPFPRPPGRSCCVNKHRSPGRIADTVSSGLGTPSQTVLRSLSVFDGIGFRVGFRKEIVHKNPYRRGTVELLYCFASPLKEFSTVPCYPLAAPWPMDRLGQLLQ